MRKGWTVVNRLEVVHESGNAKVKLIPAESGRNGKHFIVFVNGDWVYQKTWIKPFWKLDDALNEAESRIK